MLAHIDCQAQTIGAYGYGALADPASSVAIALSGLLTVFVAFFGIRLILAEPQSGRDLVGDVLRIGIVLTLATSWPAWRTLGYDVVMSGPTELASTISSAADLPGERNDIVTRLQTADDNIVILTIFGTGRNTGCTDRSDRIGDTFRGIALADQEGLSNGRLFFLAGVIGPLAIVKLGAGLLLALAPLMAGLLLFVGTRDLFFGWLRALGALAFGAFALYMVFGVQLAVLDPWLSNAVALREAQVLTPSAPTELSVINMAFALANFGILFIIIRIFFFGGLGAPRLIAKLNSNPFFDRGQGPIVHSLQTERQAPTRALRVADAVAQTMRREDLAVANRSDRSRLIDRSSRDNKERTSGPVVSKGYATAPLGSSFRATDSRTSRRTSTSGVKRDNKT
ncbi:type IV secretion system protein [Sphingorhabdus sp.]|uniref:type IV secretion system protein n=1 Tax=Sphingorhabdus sp. TaxID=1902408 RepID=UPI003BAFD4D5